MNENRLLIDLDGTLTIDDKSRDYSQKETNNRVVGAAKRALRDFDGEVAIYTARGMRSNEGDLEAIERYVLPVAEKWLGENLAADIPIVIGKAWPGPKGFYVDDRAMTPEEFVFRFDGPMSGKKVDVVLQTTRQLTIPEIDRLVSRLERFVVVGSLTVLGAHFTQLPDLKGIGSFSMNPEEALETFDYSQLKNEFVLMLDLDREASAELIFQVVMSLGEETGLLGQGVGLFREGSLSAVLRQRTHSTKLFSQQGLRWTMNLSAVKEL